MSKAVRTGFSLIEVMIVVTLVAAIAGITAGAYSFLQRIGTQLALEKLYSACRYVQQYAQATGMQQELTFDVAHNSYQAVMCKEQLPQGVVFGTVPGVQGPPAHPTAELTRPVTFAGNRIVCAPTGVVQAGAVYLTDARKTTLYALSCSVAQVSYLRKYRYDHNAWHLLAAS